MNENDKYGDLVVTLHRDSHFNLTRKSLDAFLWVRDYCKTPLYFVKIDGDLWVHIGNLVKTLNGLPKREVYYGYKKDKYVIFGEGARYGGFRSIPTDYPNHTWSFIVGPGSVFSRDVIPFINIGTQYMDLLVPCEDITIGEILHRAGIKPMNMYPNYLKYNEKLINGSIPEDTALIHVRRDPAYLDMLYEDHKETYFIPFRDD